MRGVCDVYGTRYQSKLITGLFSPRWNNRLRDIGPAAVFPGLAPLS